MADSGTTGRSFDRLLRAALAHSRARSLIWREGESRAVDGRGTLLAAALMLALLAPHASACGAVPCGYVYPRLLFDLGERGTTHTLTEAAPLRLEGTLTFTWDITAEGLAAPNPAAPIVVTFEFPRKPAWLDIAVEPSEIEVPIQPQYVEAANTATGVQLVYRYSAPIAVEARLTGTPVVDPEDPPSLLLLAQSSESGLYKPGFGVRDLALALPEALVQTAARERPAELRVGAPEPLALAPLSLEFEGATLALEAEGPLELWKPASLVASVRRGGAPARAVDMAASVMDEDNRLLYTTGLRPRGDGALPFAFTFPAPGHYRVHVAARPVPGASDVSIDPVVATFDLLLPGTAFDALRYPDAYRASYAEPVSEVHANTADLPRQFEKTLFFPVLAGADSASVQVRLRSTGAAALGPGSVYAEVLSPSDEQVAFGKLDAVTPNLDARVRGPLAPGDYRLRLYGTGANPAGLAGTELGVELGVFYPEPPLGLVDARGQPRPQAGGPIALGTGGMELDLVLHDEPAVWAPLHATLVAKDAAGRTALHPDFILTVRGEDGILYTTGHRHPHDGVLAWSFTPPAPGLYVVSAFAGPTPEASGAFWQPAVASWPLRVAAPAGGALPEAYRALYHDSTSTVRSDGYYGGHAFEKRYPLPVLAGARELAFDLRAQTMAMVQHLDGGAPALLSVELLDPSGAPVQPAPPASPSGVAGAVPLAGAEPGTYLVRVFGAGYAPLDYSGAMYELALEVAYDAPPRLALEEASQPPSAAARPVPGVGLLIGALALFAVARAARRR